MALKFTILSLFFPNCLRGMSPEPRTRAPSLCLPVLGFINISPTKNNVNTPEGSLVLRVRSIWWPKDFSMQLIPGDMAAKDSMNGIAYHKYVNDVHFMRSGVVVLLNDSVVQSSSFFCNKVKNVWNKQHRCNLNRYRSLTFISVIPADTKNIPLIHAPMALFLTYES